MFKIYCMHIQSYQIINVTLKYKIDRSPGTGVMNGHELPCRSWELNLGPVKGQSELLTSEPLLQAPVCYFLTLLCSFLLFLLPPTGAL